MFLSWRLATPPTGNLSRFLLQAGQVEGDGVSWEAPKRLDGTHACTFGSAYCYSVTDLQPGTIYSFRVRAWNLGLEEPSPWSEELVQETREVVSLPPDKSSSTAAPHAPAPTTPDPDALPTLVIVLSILGAIALMAMVIVCLWYKLKIGRLKRQMRQEEQWNQMGQLSHSSSYLPADTSTRLADSYLTSLEDSSNFGSLRSNIQTRRLPEPPRPLGEPQYAEAYEQVQVPGVWSPLESTRIQDQEVTDVEGYLRPTFADRSSPITTREEEQPGAIPPESYGAVGGPGAVLSTRSLSNLGGRAQGGASRGTSPSQPLISSPIEV